MNPTLTLSDSTVTLSGTVRATVAVPGGAVEPPQLLAPESAAAWEIAPAGPATVIDGVWTRTYVLDPLAPGDAVPVRFNAFVADGAAVTLPPQTVKVTTAVTDRTPAAARPPAGYEVPAADPVPNYAGPVAAFVLFAVVAAVFAAVRRRKRRVESAAFYDPFAVAEHMLTAAPFDPAAFAVALSRAVRGRVPGGEHRTTTELKPALPESLVAVLERCDRVKFAGTPLTVEEGRDLLAAAQTPTPV